MVAFETALLVGSLLLLLLAGFPIAIALTVAGAVYLLMHVDAWSATASILFAGLDKTAILAIPFFIVAAEVLNKGGAIGALVRFVDAFIGHWPGGLPLVAIVAIMIFSAICGSSIATAAAVGTALLPEMTARGYPRQFSVGLICAAGGLGILIPPSIPMIVYGLVTGVSVGELFKAGIVPGLLLGAMMAAYVVVATGRGEWPRRPRSSAAERRQTLRAALPVLALPFVILGSIYGGIFTPTESAAVAVIYAIAVTLPTFRRKGTRALFDAVVDSAATSAAILFVVAGAAVFGYALTDSGAPRAVASWILELKLSPIEFLLIVNVILLLLGMVLEVISVMLITLPILMPIIVKLGIDPIHFAIIMIVNMEIAVITPPIGLNLFAVSAISKIDIWTVFRAVVPFLFIILAALLLLTYVPAIVLAPLRWY